MHAQSNQRAQDIKYYEGLANSWETGIGNTLDKLKSFIEEAQRHIQKLECMKEVPPIEAYPLMWNQKSTENPQSVPDRRPGMTAFWQMQVGGSRSKK